MSENVEILETDFQTVQPIWAEKLWDSRYNFEPTSAMLYLGGFNAKIAELYQPKFFKATLNGVTAGVISGHKSSEEHYRLRGLFVMAEYRGFGISRVLVEKIVQQASLENCKMVWAAPRRTSLPLFIKAGFTQESDFTNEGFLYGPNCYVVKSL